MTAYSSDCMILILYSLHIRVLLVIDKLMKGGEEIFTTYVIPKKIGGFNGI